MSYFVVKGLDMWGGDTGMKQVHGFADAIQAAKDYISNDHRMVAVIAKTEGDKFGVWMKDARMTNASHGPNHNNCWSVFYGEHA